MENSVGSLPSGSNNENIQELISSLSKEEDWDGHDLYQYQLFWCQYRLFHAIISFQNHFQSQDNDIILATFPKSGTTWLKSLTFAIVNRSKYASLKDNNNPLLTISSHELVPFLEIDIYFKNRSPNYLEDLPKPRTFATHSPFASLPSSIDNTNCRIVYLCRNPLDQFISYWHFMSSHLVSNGGSVKGVPLSLDEAFEKICNGVQSFGPIWEHMLGYWKASQEKPDKILFSKYEDLSDDINLYVKSLADFLGCPFSEDEEKQGVIEEITKLCSFDNMKDLEVNKTGKHSTAGIKNNLFFRKGNVGDSKNYLSPSMSERLEKLIEEKLDGSGLTFKRS